MRRNERTGTASPSPGAGDELVSAQLVAVGADRPDWFSSTWVRGGGGVAALAVATVLVILAPSVLNGYVLYLVNLGAVYALAALGMTVLLGWAGQVSLLPAAFIGLGAYGTDWMYQTAHVPWGLSVVIVALVVGAVGTVLAIPALRLRGFYLAIATLALAEAVVYCFTAFTSITGGNEGQYVTTVNLFGISQTSSIWYITIIVLALALYFMNRLRRTSLGRRLLGVRDVEVAMGPLAASPAVLKLVAFALSTVLASVAGSLYAQLVTYIAPTQFDLPLLIELLVIVFLGGIDSVLGPLFGAAAVIALTEALNGVGSLEPVVFGGVLVLVILFLRRGIVSLPEVLSELRWFRTAGQRLLGRRAPVQVVDVAPAEMVAGPSVDCAVETAVGSSISEGGRR